MLQAILQQINAVAPDTVFAVEHWIGSYEDRARYGLRTLLPEKGTRSNLIRHLAGKSFRGSFGLVDKGEVQAVVDASGFAFGDQWGTDNLRLLATKAREWKRRGIPTVYLPQAWGPFRTETQRTYARTAIENLDLVFAREQTSLKHLQSLGVSSNNVFQAHDFTNLIKGDLPDDVDLPDRFACIVPNIRMLDKAKPKEQSSYLEFLCASVRELETRDIEPVFLFHDVVHDRTLAHSVHAALGRKLNTLALTCPRQLKGVLGQATVVLGSRFHALVGSLSQGVPVIATSWSHKYEELLQEYGVPEFIVATSDQKGLRAAIDTATDALERRPIVDLIRTNAARFLRQSQETFERSMATLGLTSP